MSAAEHAAADSARPVLPKAAALRAVFFDFDGVILESTDIKDRAFRELFSDLPEHQERILQHHREHLGRSRFEKFEWIYRELLGRSLEPAESLALGRRFSALVEADVLACPMVPGARALLAALEDRIDCWVVSATPQDELDLIVDRRRLRAYFRGVCGSPPEKTRVFADLLERERLDPLEVLAIGDGLTDYRAARATGVHFVARACPSSGQDWSSLPVTTVNDLTDLIEALGLVGPGTATPDD